MPLDREMIFTDLLLLPARSSSDSYVRRGAQPHVLRYTKSDFAFTEWYFMYDLSPSNHNDSRTAIARSNSDVHRQLRDLSILVPISIPKQPFPRFNIGVSRSVCWR